MNYFGLRIKKMKIKDKTFGIVQYTKGVFKLIVARSCHKDREVTTIARYRSEQLEQIIHHAKEHKLRKFTFIVGEKRGEI